MLPPNESPNPYGLTELLSREAYGEFFHQIGNTFIKPLVRDFAFIDMNEDLPTYYCRWCYRDGAEGELGLIVHWPKWKRKRYPTKLSFSFTKQKEHIEALDGNFNLNEISIFTLIQRFNQLIEVIKKDQKQSPVSVLKRIKGWISQLF